MRLVRRGFLNRGRNPYFLAFLMLAVITIRVVVTRFVTTAPSILAHDGPYARTVSSLLPLNTR
jgi:hypothetical protein